MAMAINIFIKEYNIYRCKNSKFELYAIVMIELQNLIKLRSVVKNEKIQISNLDCAYRRHCRLPLVGNSNQYFASAIYAGII